MKISQSVLPAINRRECQADRTRERHLAREIKTRLAEIFHNGFHYCLDCEARCERLEGENGQPAHCDRCGSARIEWNPPLWAAIGKEAA